MTAVWKDCKWTRKTYVDFCKYLSELAEEPYREFQSKLILDGTDMLGVRIPILRKLAKEICKGDGTAFLEVCGTKYQEERMLYTFVAAYYANQEDSFENAAVYIKRSLPLIINWSLCDSFCSSLKVADKFPKDCLMFIDDCVHSEGVYEQRFGYVMLLQNYIKEPYLDQIFAYCDEMHSEEYYVRMAVAWLLSICYVKEEKPTLSYLHQCKLDVFTYNKTLQKIVESNCVTKEQKVRIKAMKIPAKDA